MGGAPFIRALGVDTPQFYEQLGELRGREEAFAEMGDRFQSLAGMPMPSFARMYQQGGFTFVMPPPNIASCGCPFSYAPTRTMDFGARPGVPGWTPAGRWNRMEGARFEHFLRTHPFARQQFEMSVGGRIVPDGFDDGRITVEPFPPGFFPSGGPNGRYGTVAGMFSNMGRAANYDAGYQAGYSSAMENMYPSMMMNGLAACFGGFGFAPPGAMPIGSGGPFPGGAAGPAQGAFAMGPNDGGDVSGVLNDPSLTVEDKVTLMLMVIMNQMDKDIENEANHVSQLQQQQNNGQSNGGGGQSSGAASSASGSNGNSPSIDVETLKLKRLIDKRSQMFDMLRQIIDKYNQTAKGVIDSMR
jgi:hypothetical protein